MMVNTLVGSRESIIILLSFINVDPGSNNRYYSADLLQHCVPALADRQGSLQNSKSLSYLQQELKNSN